MHSSHPSFPDLFSRQALYWPERRALQCLWWTEPSPPVNSAQKGSAAALHSRLCHWQPNPSILPTASAIICPRTSLLEAVAFSTYPGGSYEGQAVQLPPHGESSLILFSGRDKWNIKIFRSWTSVDPSEPLPTQNILWFGDIWLQHINRKWKQVFFVLILEYINSWKFIEGWVKALLFSLS